MFLCVVGVSMQDNVAAVMDRLQYVEWQPYDQSMIRFVGITVSLCPPKQGHNAGMPWLQPVEAAPCAPFPTYPRDRDEPRALAQFSALQATKLTIPPTSTKTVTVHATVPLTAAVMQALSALPAGQELEMTDCSWPLPAAEYKSLATHIPTQYTD